jgi:superfamily II DNA or RNA helicase
VDGGGDPVKRELFDYQEKYLDELPKYDGKRWPRTCLYYRTGAGKSLTAMSAIEQWGYQSVLVVAPPSTHKQWVHLGMYFGIEVNAVSHAKFRMKDFKPSRVQPIIADEFHLFGGQRGKGFNKFDRVAAGLQAPIQLLSATPNWNDAERCYCIHRVLNRQATKGGYLQWLYENCHTKQNPFSMVPEVTGFRDYPDAASFLADLPNVWYLPDTLVYTIDDIPYDQDLPAEFTEYLYNRRDERLMASEMEYRHTARFQGLVGYNTLIRPEVYAKLVPILDNYDPLLIFVNHASIARALSATLTAHDRDHRIITGETSKVLKQSIIDEFNRSEVPVLIGTASIATGTDGMDRVCDALLILDDTDDDSLRRQLIGRIMPRGAEETSAHGKTVFRLVPL